MATRSRPELQLDWCSHAAAKYAVEHWHYSKRMPKSKLAKIGVWEDGLFTGAIVFGLGATPEIGKHYQLQMIQICELVRVALHTHRTPVSKLLSIACKMLHRNFPGLRLIVSFADTSQGHHGGIYQSAGWVYVGSDTYHAYRVHGIVVHPRTLYHKYGVGGQSIPWLHTHVDPHAKRIANGLKHKYLYPLDAAMRAQIEPLRQPYPKRATSIVADASGVQPEEGGAAPTVALAAVEMR